MATTTLARTPPPGADAVAPPTRVWDLAVRLFHWSLVASFAVAWISAEEWQDLHLWAGYAAAALVAFRLVWGLAGTRYARFRQFVRRPRVVVAYPRMPSRNRAGMSCRAARPATSATTRPAGR